MNVKSKAISRLKDIGLVHIHILNIAAHPNAWSIISARRSSSPTDTETFETNEDNGVYIVKFLRQTYVEHLVVVRPERMTFKLDGILMHRGTRLVCSARSLGVVADGQIIVLAEYL